MTGSPLAHEWQQTHGPLPLSARLMPRVPFVANGEFGLNNLIQVADRQRMVYGGMLASRLDGLQDGESLTLPYHLD